MLAISSIVKLYSPPPPDEANGIDLEKSQFKPSMEEKETSSTKRSYHNGRTDNQDGANVSHIFHKVDGDTKKEEIKKRKQKEKIQTEKTAGEKSRENVSNFRFKPGLFTHDKSFNNDNKNYNSNNNRVCSCGLSLVPAGARVLPNLSRHDLCPAESIQEETAQHDAGLAGLAARDRHDNPAQLLQRLCGKPDIGSGAKEIGGFTAARQLHFGLKPRARESR